MKTTIITSSSYQVPECAVMDAIAEGPLCASRKGDNESFDDMENLGGVWGAY